ncbi:unnamed protein product [Phytophthora fragariaefolia]|uniref:Unnamed protein product n=1 Tax=Phytophthora fragariaefolia TaxID=1490495 RepID=A0A9W6Y1L9_9STRA|nr:unnamed protein product [Phytophthora fragariaefolia]
MQDTTVTGEVYEAVAETIFESFEPDSLDTFCELKLGQASANVTEGMLTAEIETIVSRINDVGARVIDYFNNFGNIVRENGLVECFEGVDGKKEKYKPLIASLHPEVLSNEVKQCVRLTHKPATANSRLLYYLVVKKAKEHNRQFLRLKQDNDKECDNLGRAKTPQTKKAVDNNQITAGDKRNRDG